MGGHGALIMALKNPGKYTSVSGLCTNINACSVPWGIKAFSSYLGEDEKMHGSMGQLRADVCQ